MSLPSINTSDSLASVANEEKVLTKASSTIHALVAALTSVFDNKIIASNTEQLKSMMHKAKRSQVCCIVCGNALQFNLALNRK